MNRRFLLGLMSLFCFSFAANAARTGTDTGGGGDAIAIEFVARAKSILALFRGDPRLRKEFPEVNVTAFERAINQTHVESMTQSLIVDSHEVDAKNYPARHLIQVNRARWLQVRREETLWALVLHEYLGIMKVHDTVDYPISSRFSKWLTEHDVEPPPPQYTTLVSISGASKVEDNPVTGNKRVFAAMKASNSGCETSPSTSLHIVLRTTNGTDAAWNRYVVAVANSSTGNVPSRLSEPPPMEGGLYSLDLDWGSICSAFGSPNCTVDFSGTLRVGLSPDGVSLMTGESVTIEVGVSSISAGG